MKNLVIIPFAIFAIVLFYGCPEDAPALEEEEENNTEYVSTGSINETHIKGTTSCPQSLGSVTLNNGDGLVDSVVLVSNIDGLEINFDANNNSIIFSTFSDSGYEIQNLNVEFTCGVPQTIDDTIILDFYKDGVFVRREEISVKVEVQE